MPSINIVAPLNGSNVGSTFPVIGTYSTAGGGGSNPVTVTVVFSYSVSNQVTFGPVTVTTGNYNIPCSGLAAGNDVGIVAHLFNGTPPTQIAISSAIDVNIS